MKSDKKIFIPLLIITAAFMFSYCSTSDKARIVIELDAQPVSASAAVYSWVDRIISFISPVTPVYAAPLGITIYRVQVTNHGDVLYNRLHPADSSVIECEIPAGTSRTIAVTAYIDASDPRAVREYGGEATVDLEAGETKSVSIDMAPTETKLLIPDYSNDRVVQIDDMSGTQWRTLNSSSISGITISFGLNARDVAVDAQGQIYISNYTFSTAEPSVIRVDSIPASGTVAGTVIVPGSTVLNVSWLAVDMKNNYLYSATDTTVYGCNLDGSGFTGIMSIPVGAGNVIKGINLDAEGIMYLTYTNGGGVSVITKFDPQTASVTLASFDFAAHFGNSAYQPTDVVVKGDRVYATVASTSSAATQLVVELTDDLVYLASYGIGSTATAETGAGVFFGPAHFAAVLNRRLYILDDGGIGGGWDSINDKLVAIDDMAGTNWEAFGGNGGGVDQFRFYYGC